jgi:hypothetical protein
MQPVSTKKEREGGSAAACRIIWSCAHHSFAVHYSFLFAVECPIAVAVPAAFLNEGANNHLDNNNDILLHGGSQNDDGVSPPIIAQTAKAFASLQSDVAELSLMVIKAAGIAALYASDEESRIAIATSFATVKLADKGLCMAGSLLMSNKEALRVRVANLTPLRDLLDQYDMNDVDVETIVADSGLETLVLAAKETARAAIAAAKAANVCVNNATTHSAIRLAEAVANTSAKAARLNRAAVEASSSFL